MKTIAQIRWGLIVIVVAAFVATIIIGNFYHPWDEVLEKGSVGLMDFEELQNASSSQSMEGLEFWDRVDVMKGEIGRFLFSDETPDILSKIAHSLLSPIEDTAKSVSLAMSYSGFFDTYRYSNPDPFISALVVIVFFLLYYGFAFGKNKVIEKVEAKEQGLPTKIENYVIAYCIEGVSAFLCLFVTYWVIMGMRVLERFGITQVLYGGLFTSGNALIVIPSFIIFMGVLIFFIIMTVSLIICVVPYYFMMALPVMLVAVLPLWMWMRLVICLALEVVIIVKVFPWLFERLNLWNTVKLLTNIVLFIPRLIFHPIDTLSGGGE